MNRRGDDPGRGGQRGRQQELPWQSDPRRQQEVRRPSDPRGQPATRRPQDPRLPPDPRQPPDARRPPDPRAGDDPRRQRPPDRERRRGGRLDPMSVTEAVRAARHVLERHIGALWIDGEITSVSRPSSGHIYFALKDQRSQIRAVMWRSDAARLRFRIEDGQRLRCRGQLTIYDREGKFQLYVQHAEPAGLGADAMALEQLKRKLAAEGLFAPERKRALPVLPRRIGVVTSRSGAAIRDIIRAVHRRFPVPILVADASVQGTAAPRRIAGAIRAICRTDVDVVIVGRGGGSASDLAAFNEEIVVRAIAECPVPTISAVGHEVDVSLSDLAADRRAATPTMAGEMAVPVLADLAEVLRKEERRLHREAVLQIRTARQELDRLADRAHRRMTVRIRDHRRELDALAAKLEARHPRAHLTASRAALQDLHARLDAVMRRRVDAAGRAFSSLAAKLDTLSPLRVLDRGYAIATTGEHVVTDAGQVAPGDALHLRLSRGTLGCRVEHVHPGADQGTDER